jgi:aspartate racemase
MKKLGIIGGAGPLASALFYETLVHESYRLQRLLPEILLLNYPFNRGLTPEEKLRDGSLVREELLHCLNALETGGASIAILVCNTLHLELAKLPRGSVCFCSIPDLVLEKIQEEKQKRLLLLGTQNTCNSPLYHKSDLTIFRPLPEGQKIIDQAIDHVLEGNISEKDARLIEHVIESFPEKIDGVILGCTDLPVLHHHFPIQVDQPIYDSVKIPAKSILRFL